MKSLPHKSGTFRASCLEFKGRRSIIALCFFFALILIADAPAVLAQQAQQKEVLAKLEELQAKLDKIEAGQKASEQAHQAILEELKVLKIWVRRN
ncbi:MAG: hypothetical protein A2Z83_08660 [Omnitrophica bacterium GWA2_52_8]|nr:MAG: hypothetical protein A2Z83_08660 [Omnitrophica bacterium GWA2_52_8]